MKNPEKWFFRKNYRIDVCACVGISGIIQPIEFKFFMEVKPPISIICIGIDERVDFLNFIKNVCKDSSCRKFSAIAMKNY